MRSKLVDEQGLRAREHRALAHVMRRFWLDVFPQVCEQLREWEQIALEIPDPVLREQALATLRSERLSAAGAALFAATPRRPCPALVRALVAYQVATDYLDTLAEQPSADPIANGARLHRALADAVAPAPAAVRPDWYGLHPRGDDGGYLAALVAACRESCAALPSYAAVADAAVREARRNAVQGLNHAAAGPREAGLIAWAAAQDDDGGDARWFELAAAGASSLAVLALIAAAARPATTAADAERVRRAYFPWIEALSTLLDSLVDRERDARTGELNFVSHYPSNPVAAARLGEIAGRAMRAARGLPDGERHAVLVAGMVSLHLSEASAGDAAAEAAAVAVLTSVDGLAARLLLPLLRTWRALRALKARREKARGRARRERRGVGRAPADSPAPCGRVAVATAE
jgi:tetraprenyl-beta-curcumene synthase